MIASVQRFAPGVKLVFWDLGLTNVQHVKQVIFKVSLGITGRERLIQSHLLLRFCFELSGNSN